MSNRGAGVLAALTVCPRAACIPARRHAGSLPDKRTNTPPLFSAGSK